MLLSFLSSCLFRILSPSISLYDVRLSHLNKDKPQSREARIWLVASVCSYGSLQGAGNMITYLFIYLLFYCPDSSTL